jgi:hypothetical protein
LATKLTYRNEEKYKLLGQSHSIRIDLTLIAGKFQLKQGTTSKKFLVSLFKVLIGKFRNLSNEYEASSESCACRLR